MFQSKNEDRNTWQKNKQNSFEQLKKDQEGLLKMHIDIKPIIVEHIQKFMHYNYEDITSSQLRNLFNQVLDVDKPKEIILKKIKLAYISGRTDQKKKQGMIDFLDLLDELFGKVNTDDGKESEKRLKGLKTFFEAAVAYHKYYDSLQIHFQIDKKMKK
jgi:CRISPR type III-A-associated protein Csm2